jgi:thiamine pyrophosphokinase
MHALLVSGGAAPSAADLDRVGDVDLVVAVDRGLDHAVALGLSPDLLIGDLDSVSRRGIEWAEFVGMEIERHPRVKDATDMALGMAGAIARGADRITVLASAAGRLDHLLGTMLHLAATDYRDVDVRALIDGADVMVVRTHVEVTGEPGQLVSVVAVGGPAVVTLAGFAFPLDAQILDPTTTLGMSNEIGDIGRCTVDVISGVVLVIVPAVPDEPDDVGLIDA